MNYSLLREVEETLDKQIEIDNDGSDKDTVPCDDNLADSMNQSGEVTEPTASAEEHENEGHEIVVNDLKRKENDT